MDKCSVDTWLWPKLFHMDASTGVVAQMQQRAQGAFVLRLTCCRGTASGAGPAQPKPSLPFFIRTHSTHKTGAPPDYFDPNGQVCHIECLGGVEWWWWWW